MTESISKDAKIFCIVESPNKKQTISQILKSAGYTNVKVEASVGHIVEIKDGAPYKNTGIDPHNDFKTNFQVMSSKKEVFNKLKAGVADADVVILATDEDREGEAISYHLKTQLKIPEKKYRRITFHEITKSAIIEAMNNPRKIDNNLVDAAKTRAIVDKLVGYSISPIVQTELNCRSAGRCQSAGLLLVVEREEEIRNFIPEKYFDLFVHFSKNSTQFKAKYVGTEDKKIDRIKTQDECNKIKSECVDKIFFVNSILKKEQKDYPKPPFTTSTFQQEANKVLGMSIDVAMACAQKLFEGVNINGTHTALVTYLRTDDASMSPEFAATLEKYVLTNYGSQYKASVKTGASTNANAQEAHECFRVINLSMTPSELSKLITDKNLLRVYKLIWERTVMCAMAPAIISDTQYNILCGRHLFVMHSREVIFDGYRKIHVSSEDEIGKDELIREVFGETEILQNTKLIEEAKETKPPSRYTEATFIKELDKRGIGRPSTFATIISTILSENRGYCVIDNKNIIPTQKGIELSHFLSKSFPDLISLTYTTTLEDDLDKIATGKVKYLDCLNSFFSNLEDSVSKVTPEAKTCPMCGGSLIRKRGKFGFFWGCQNWAPNNTGCNYVKKD